MTIPIDILLKDSAYKLGQFKPAYVNALQATITLKDAAKKPVPYVTRPPRVKVQVKRQQQAVSVEGLRSFMAVLGDEDVGLFVCTGASPRTQKLKRAPRKSATSP